MNHEFLQIIDKHIIEIPSELLQAKLIQEAHQKKNKKATSFFIITIFSYLSIFFMFRLIWDDLWSLLASAPIALFISCVLNIVFYDEDITDYSSIYKNAKKSIKDQQLQFDILYSLKDLIKQSEINDKNLHKKDLIKSVKASYEQLKVFLNSGEIELSLQLIKNLRPRVILLLEANYKSTISSALKNQSHELNEQSHEIGAMSYDALLEHYNQSQKKLHIEQRYKKIL